MAWEEVAEQYKQAEYHYKEALCQNLMFLEMQAKWTYPVTKARLES